MGRSIDKILKDQVKGSIVGSVVNPLKPLELSYENKFACELAQREFSGFDYRNVRSLLKTLKSYNLNDMVIHHIKCTWIKLKMVLTLFPETKKLCSFLFRNCLLIENQRLYEETMDYLSESFSTYMKGLHSFTKIPKPGMKGQIEVLLGTIPVEMWIPTSALPMWNDLTKERMSLAFEPWDPKEELLEEFRSLVTKYLKSLDIKELFIPPVDATVKTGSQKYNDGGSIRYDYETPKLSFDSKFLYQKFNTKPLQTREVWLPGKGVKINNSFWMMIGRQILLKEPSYPDPDPMVTWDRLKTGLTRFGYFDVSGFGFQYPREYLSIIMDVIFELYPNSILKEYKDIAQHIFKNVSVQMPDGKVVRPPRGIGLGYYEDLKTIGVLAIIKRLEPKSVYGDQALTQWNLTGQTVEALQNFGFIFKPGKYKTMRQIVKWSGQMMTPHSVWRPRSLTTPLVGLLESQFHFERKFQLRSLYENFPEYREKDRYISFHYELIFGYEFMRGESQLHLDNGGCRVSVQPQLGFLKTWKVQRLTHPGITFNVSSLHETPFKSTVTMREAKDYSIMRKKVYRESPKMDSIFLDYVDPRIELRLSKKPPYTRIGAATPEWADFKLMMRHHATVGKITSGLMGEDIQTAVRRQIFASDPFKAEATGGYMVTTPWFSTRGQSEEFLQIGNYLSEFDINSSYIASRVDLGPGPTQFSDPLFDSYDYIVSTNRLAPVKKRIYSPSIVSSDSVEKFSREENPLKLIKLIHINDDQSTTVAKASELLPNNFEEDYLDPIEHEVPLDYMEDMYTQSFLDQDINYSDLLYEIEE